jgi:hypothetical protein
MGLVYGTDLAWLGGDVALLCSKTMRLNGENDDKI